MNNVQSKTKYLVKISLLAAISVMLMYFDFPILPAFPWLKIDASDLPALIGSFSFGPVAGIIIEALKNLLIMLVKGSDTGGVGQLANFLIGASFVGTAGLIYIRNKTRKTAIIALIAAVVVMSIVGVLANYYILMPLYGMDKMPKGDLINYVLYGVIPFNFIKALMVSAITLIIYKRVVRLINGAVTAEKKETKRVS